MGRAISLPTSEPFSGSSPSTAQPPSVLGNVTLADVLKQIPDAMVTVSQGGSPLDLNDLYKFIPRSIIELLRANFAEWVENFDPETRKIDDALTNLKLPTEKNLRTDFINNLAKQIAKRLQYSRQEISNNSELVEEMFSTVMVWYNTVFYFLEHTIEDWFYLRNHQGTQVETYVNQKYKTANETQKIALVSLLKNVNANSSEQVFLSSFMIFLEAFQFKVKKDSIFTEEELWILMNKEILSFMIEAIINKRAEATKMEDKEEGIETEEYADLLITAQFIVEEERRVTVNIKIGKIIVKREKGKITGVEIFDYRTDGLLQESLTERTLVEVALKMVLGRYVAQFKSPPRDNNGFCRYLIKCNLNNLPRHAFPIRFFVKETGMHGGRVSLIEISSKELEATIRIIKNYFSKLIGHRKEIILGNKNPTLGFANATKLEEDEKKGGGKVEGEGKGEGEGEGEGEEHFSLSDTEEDITEPTFAEQETQESYDTNVTLVYRDGTAELTMMIDGARQVIKLKSILEFNDCNTENRLFRRGALVRKAELRENREFLWGEYKSLYFFLRREGSSFKIVVVSNLPKYVHFGIDEKRYVYIKNGGMVMFNYIGPDESIQRFFSQNQLNYNVPAPLEQEGGYIYVNHPNGHSYPLYKSSKGYYIIIGFNCFAPVDFDSAGNPIIGDGYRSLEALNSAVTLKEWLGIFQPDQHAWSNIEM